MTKKKEPIQETPDEAVEEQPVKPVVPYCTLADLHGRVCSPGSQIPEYDRPRALDAIQRAAQVIDQMRDQPVAARDRNATRRLRTVNAEVAAAIYLGDPDWKSCCEGLVSARTAERMGGIKE